MGSEYLGSANATAAAGSLNIEECFVMVGGAAGPAG